MAEKIRPRSPQPEIAHRAAGERVVPKPPAPMPTVIEERQKPPPAVTTVLRPASPSLASVSGQSEMIRQPASVGLERASEIKNLPRPKLSVETFEMEDYLEGHVESKPAAPAPLQQPLQALLEREMTGKTGHMSEFALHTVVSNPDVNEALVRAHEQGKSASDAQSDLGNKTKALEDAQARLAEIDSRIPSDSKLPAAQSEYGEAVGELSKFYLVRAMDQEQRQAETEFIESRLETLTDQLNKKTTTPEQKRNIIKEIGDLEGWMKSLIAEPYDDTPIDPAQMMQMMQLLLIAQIAAGIPLGNGSEADAENDQLASAQLSPVQQSPEDLAANQQASEKLWALRIRLQTNSKELFGEDQAEGAQDLGQGLQNELKYNADASNVNAPETLTALQDRAQILSEYIATIQDALPTATPEDRKELASDLSAFRHELNLLSAVGEKKGALDKIAAQTDRSLIAARGEASGQVQALEAQVDRASVNQDKQLRLQNLRDYQTLSTTLTTLTEQIRTLSKQVKIDNDYLQSNEVKTPKLKQEAIDSLADAQKKLQELSPAFMTTMHQLEVFENRKRIERKGADPYPETANLEGITNWAKGLVMTTGDEMPSKAELMRQYQLAKNGLDGITGAYADAAKGMASRVYDAATSKDASALMGQLSLDNLTSVMGDFKDFAMKNPVLARELAANLMHTYAILSADGTSGTTQLLNSARGILQRRTAENIATDMLLGTREHLYSLEEDQTLTPAQLAFFDLAERAPYMAAAYIGAQGKNLGGSWAQTVASFIPGIGTNRVVQAMAGASGGAAEVKAQKIAAEKISRDQEVIANSLLSGFNALGKGEGVSGAIKAAATYGLVRQTLQIAGTMGRDLHEGGSVGGTIANYLKSYYSKWTKTPGTEAAKVGTAGLVGAAAAGATGVAVVGATSVATAPVAAAVLALFGTTIATRAAYSKIADWWNPERATMRQLQESAERLKDAANTRLPTIYRDSLIDPPEGGRAVSKEEAQRASALVAGAVKTLDPQVFKDAANIGGKTPLEQQTAQAKFIFDAVGKEVEKQHRAELVSASARVEADPQIEALQKRLASVSAATSQPGIRRQLDEVQRSLPPGEAADSVEAELREKINALRGGRAPITMGQIEAVKSDIATMRMRQVESASLEDANLQARLISVPPPTGGAAAAAASPLLSPGRKRV